MHKEGIALWQHDHVFNKEKRESENRTFLVVIITLIAMIFEIVFGWIFNSMALFADGWHMGTHATALSISLVAYILARKYLRHTQFSFGTWKIEILGAYTSAIVLGIVGLAMIGVSVERMINPLNIQYDHALIVAVLGLLVNFVCAVILKSKDDHDLNQDSHHHDHHHTMDLNLKSAYLHVIADALTSILAIVALLGAKYFRLNWLDPAMGILGALLIIRWAAMLIKETVRILVDKEGDSSIVAEVQETIESDGDSKISDLHVWQVSQDKYACIVAIVTSNNCSVNHYKERLKSVHELAHVTVEISSCNV